MISWRHLERPRTDPRLADTFVEHLVNAPRRSPATGDGAPIGPVDLVILAIGLANAWQLSARDLLDAAREDPTDPHRIARHRAALVTAAQRISRPSARPGGRGRAHRSVLPTPPSTAPSGTSAG